MRRRRLRNIIVGLVYTLLHACSLYAQDSTQQKDKPFAFRAAYQYLRSTHATIFNGASIDGDYAVSPHFTAGLGIQYAGTHLHPDNGWILTDLRLLPVYTSQIYTLLPTHRLQPFLHTEEGISFNHYNKLDTAVAPQPYKVSEKGLYLAGNAGINVVLLKHLKLFTELGYKGYKHSAHDLDVNPHGLTARFGVEL